MNIDIRQLILLPAIISLVVTALRLTGELMKWSPTFFNPEAGGGGAPIGISWLVPIFGVYFAIKLIGMGEGPGSAGRAIGLPVAGIAVAIGLAFAVGALFGQSFYTQIVGGILMSFVALAVAYKGWPILFRTLVAYALAARIPVAIIMFFAIMGDWGTHYDVPPPGDFPQMGWFAKWVWIGLAPQLTAWIAFTVVVGMLFGGLASLFKKPRTAVGV